MSDQRWTDLIVGDRMAVDQAFDDRLAQSGFTRQEWGLIMTAVEFEIEHPADEERARLTADTSRIPQILPEVENVRSQMASVGGGAGGGSSGGIMDTLRGALGFGGGSKSVDDEEVREATRLVETYAEELQVHLEDKGKWSRVREAAQE